MTLVGTAIDEAGLKGLPEFMGKEVTESDLASYALKNKAHFQTGNDPKGAMELVNGYKEEYGDGVSTLINIYNASGRAVSLRSTHDSSGHIGKYPYDSRIQNGQWSAVLHTKTAGAARGSVAAIGYTCGNQVFTIAWNNPWSSSSSNSAWCAVLTSSDYGAKPWGDMIDNADEGKLSGSHESGGLGITWSLGDTSSPLFQVTLYRV